MNTSTNERAKYASDEERWQAILQKDRNADGKFFFSVETTGVYCRPSCPARPARRENVAFHKSAEDAERAGFRHLKRYMGVVTPSLADVAEVAALLAERHLMMRGLQGISRRAERG